MNDSAPEAGHHGAGRLDRLDRERNRKRCGDDLGHLDGLPARCGRGGADTPGVSDVVRSRDIKAAIVNTGEPGGLRGRLPDQPRRHRPGAAAAFDEDKRRGPASVPRIRRSRLTLASPSCRPNFVVHEDDRGAEQRHQCRRRSTSPRWPVRPRRRARTRLGVQQQYPRGARRGAPATFDVTLTVPAATAGLEQRRARLPRGRRPDRADAGGGDRQRWHQAASSVLHGPGGRCRTSTTTLASTVERACRRMPRCRPSATVTNIGGALVLAAPTSTPGASPTRTTRRRARPTCGRWAYSRSPRPTSSGQPRCRASGRSCSP